jgi:hypothetical protein
MADLTILLYGSTGAGKTAQVGELAEHYFKTLKKRTRIYAADKGGWEVIKPHIDLKIIEIVPLFGDVFVWLDHAVKGDKIVNGKWVPGIDPDIAMYAFEGFTSISDNLMLWMSQASSNGVNIGGGGSFSFVAGGKEVGAEKVKIGSNNMAHYSVAQQQVFEKSTQSQSLPGTVLWTAGDRRGEDDANGGVVGPQAAGKALTGELPRCFQYTFRIVSEVLPNQDTTHVLYTDSHVEMQSKGMAKALSNGRVPLAGGDTAKVPSKISPASLVQVLQLLEKRQDAAKIAMMKRLGLNQ